MHRGVTKKILAGAGALVVSLVVLASSASASSLYPTGSMGVDVGYPNCNTKVPSATFGIVGVTGGLAYSHNACAAVEAKHFTNLSLYVNTGLNASQDSSYYTAAQAQCGVDIYCAAYHYGYNAALDAFTYATSQGITSAKWWLDVETGNTWNSDVVQNQQSLQGEYDALMANGVTSVGVYSTTAQWQGITGGWQNNWPSWGATTWTTAKQARKYCTGHEFTGGPSLLMQYQGRKSQLDQDVAC